MKCEYCKIEIHPVNLIYINKKPYHYLCADFVKLEKVDSEPLTMLQYVTLGLIILGGGIAIYYAFKLGLHLAKIIKGF